MHILVAPNAFKHSLSAAEAALAIGEGLLASSLECTVELFPVGDGGDGTAELIVKKHNGVWVEGEVQDPLGRTINAAFGWMENSRTAVIEMANASGIRLLQSNELNPLQATSFGTGQQIKLALDKGAKTVMICMGGSATVDGGTGILKALGICFFEAAGEELSNLPGSLAELASMDVSKLDQRILDAEVTVLCDVNNMLLGEYGAAAIFGPQKGASAAGVKILDEALGQFAAVTLQQTGKDISTIQYGGTAGGAAAGLYAFINAKLVHGIDYFLELTGFDEALKKSQLVITGEGQIDEQTMQGKGPFGVAQRAKLRGIPVIGFAGKVPAAINSDLQKYFDVLLCINNEPADLAAAIQHTYVNLRRTAQQVGELLAINK